MFDIGFSEIFLIAVVALLVLGPERLPKAARFAGLWVRRARAQWYSVKSEFERELADEELKRSLLDARDGLRQAGQQLHESGASLKRELESLDPDRPSADVSDPAETLAGAADRSARGSEHDDHDAGARPPAREPGTGTPATGTEGAVEAPSPSIPAADDHASRP